MVHTLDMRPWWQRTGILLAGLATAGSAGWAQTNPAAQSWTQTAAHWQSAIGQAAGKTPDARVLVLDIGSGHLLASAHLAEASRTLATPGSTLKPLILYFALASKRWDPERRVACSRQMHIGSHQLNCSHPAADPMDAEQALTWSCNSYFAELAGTLAPEELRQALSTRGLLAATGLTSQENVAAFREPRTREQVQMAALGVEGIRVTLPELAEAYRSLAIELEAHPEARAAEVVRAGLTDSASFGMAGAASLGGVPVAGKTGTASAESGGASHGWFVGLAPAESPRVVVAVYLPAGHGSDAAQVAAILLAHSPLRKP
ncbi:MAG: penicillin-binding transpeptidase domain-containing protein [Terracidiphilus sp.]|jgi:cell division protein FtsI/penicillin-binding protein 2